MCLDGSVCCFHMCVLHFAANTVAQVVYIHKQCMALPDTCWHGVCMLFFCVHTHVCYHSAAGDDERAQLV